MVQGRASVVVRFVLEVDIEWDQRIFKMDGPFYRCTYIITA